MGGHLLRARAKAEIWGNKYGATRSAGNYLECGWCKVVQVVHLVNWCSGTSLRRDKARLNRSVRIHAPWAQALGALPLGLKRRHCRQSKGEIRLDRHCVPHNKGGPHKDCLRWVGTSFGGAREPTDTAAPASRAHL